MIILECEQGSEAWHNARLGIPTASKFDKIITSTGNKSTQAKSYMAELIAECVTGNPKDDFKSADMERGIELEPVARARYELVTGNDVEEVGGVFLDEEKNIMASPDGLIPSLKKGIEIKCPRIGTHIQNIWDNKAPTKYLLQIQGGMWITGYDTWDFISFCPEFTPQPILIITVKRDEKLIETMDKEIRAFSKTLDAYKKEMVAA